MKFVICGLSISSAWGNGHATLLRGLFRALNRRGHELHFFERDAPYYAAHRDTHTFAYVDLHLYSELESVLPVLRRHLADADAAIVTSYCPDGSRASELITDSYVPCKIFYDMDTPVTLSRLDRGEIVDYLPAAGLRHFDLILSYTGGETLTRLRERLQAQRVAPLYGWVDPDVHHPTHPRSGYVSDLSYLGTYAADRQQALQDLLLAPAHQLPRRTFVIGGPMYPDAEQWPKNVQYRSHVPPAEHPSFYCSSRLTLNITRGAMAALGYCPSGRLFEAAACGTPVLSDWWTGLDNFFTPGEEILIARTTEDAIAAISADSEALRRIGSRARERALDCHTAEIRARQLLEMISHTRSEHQTTNAEAAACALEEV